jgi:uncharacterized protein (DUF1330 family)
VIAQFETGDGLAAAAFADAARRAAARFRGTYVLENGLVGASAAGQRYARIDIVSFPSDELADEWYRQAARDQLREACSLSGEEPSVVLSREDGDAMGGPAEFQIT